MTTGGYHTDTSQTRDIPSYLADLNSVSGAIVDSCIKIHKNLGPGLLESAYQQCLAYELTKRDIPFEQERVLPVRYEEILIENAYRVDFIVCNQIIVELKGVDRLHAAHEAQTLTYLRLSKLPLALLINFGQPLLKDGIRRYAR